MKEINLPWIDSRNVHCPTDEPNPTHLESSGRGKPHLIFPSQSKGLKPNLTTNDATLNE